MDKLPSALELFRLGLDTTQIAARLGVTEAEAALLVIAKRTIERGLPIRYERQTRRAA